MAISGDIFILCHYFDSLPLLWYKSLKDFGFIRNQLSFTIVNSDIPSGSKIRPLLCVWPLFGSHYSKDLQFNKYCIYSTELKMFFFRLQKCIDLWALKRWAINLFAQMLEVWKNSKFRLKISRSWNSTFSMQLLPLSPTNWKNVKVLILNIIN